MADTAGPRCETYAAYQGSYDYSNDCPYGSPTGHLTFSWSEGDFEGEASTPAKTQLVAGGLAASNATVDYSGVCGEHEGHAVPEDIRFQYGGDSGDEYSCGALHLHRPGPQTVTCTRMDDAGVTDPATCTMIFTPAS